MTWIEASTWFDNEWYSCDSATGVVTKGKSCKTQSDGNTVCGTQLDECVAATPAACEPKCEEVTDGSVKKVKVTTCSETGVATTNEYTDKSCKSATEVGVCLNDAKRCATGSTVGIETCANGEWGTAVACSSTDADAETFECVAEATCKIKTCKNDKTPSEDGLTCVAGGRITFPMTTCGSTEGDSCSSKGSGYNTTLIRTIDNVKAELKGNYTGGTEANRSIKDSTNGLFTITSLDGAKLNKIIITYVFTGSCTDADVVEIKADSNVVSTISCTTDKQIDHSISFPVATSVTISKKGGTRQFKLYKLVVEKQ